MKWPWRSITATIQSSGTAGCRANCCQRSTPIACANTYGVPFPVMTGTLMVMRNLPETGPGSRSVTTGWRPDSTWRASAVLAVVGIGVPKGTSVSSTSRPSASSSSVQPSGGWFSADARA